MSFEGLLSSFFFSPYLHVLIKHLTIIEPENKEIDVFYIVQKRRSVDFKALNVCNVWSGV